MGGEEGECMDGSVESEMTEQAKSIDVRARLMEAFRVI